MKKIILFSSIIVFVDQLIKSLVIKNISNLEIIPNLFTLSLQYNKGIALSIPLQGWLQIVVILVVLFGGGFFIWKNFDLSQIKYQLIISGILGGAIGNLIDRFKHGAVVDYIAIWKFPVFNFADTCIFVGVCFIIYFELNQPTKP